MSEFSPVLSILETSATIRGKAVRVTLALRSGGGITVNGRPVHPLGTRGGDYRYATTGDTIISVPGEAIDRLQRLASAAAGKGK